MRSAFPSTDLSAISLDGRVADLWPPADGHLAQLARTGIRREGHREKIPSQWLAGLLQPAARLHGLGRGQLRPMAPRCGRPRDEAGDVLARGIARASLENADHASRFRRGLELHWALERRAARVRARPR